MTLTPGGKEIKYNEEILWLLDVVWTPKQVAVMQCRQKAGTLEAKGHRKADKEAKQAAMATPPSKEEALAMPLLLEIGVQGLQPTLQIKGFGLPRKMGMTLKEDG